MPMGITSENVAARFGVGREEQDAFAAESHARAHRAQREGLFEEEILPVRVRDGRGHLIYLLFFNIYFFRGGRLPFLSIFCFPPYFSLLLFYFIFPRFFFSAFPPPPTVFLFLSFRVFFPSFVPCDFCPGVFSPYFLSP